MIEATADGVRIVPDALRKVHVETDQPLQPRLRDVRAARMAGTARSHAGSHGSSASSRDSPLTAADGPTLAFSGFGEPLVHPHWQEMMRLARGRQHRVELITNGLLVDAEVARALVDLGVAQVTVSVDGGDEAAYARMRGVPAAGALAAVHHLLDARLHTRRPMAIGVAAVATRSTVGQPAGAARLGDRPEAGLRLDWQPRAAHRGDGRRDSLGARRLGLGVP